MNQAKKVLGGAVMLGWVMMTGCVQAGIQPAPCVLRSAGIDVATVTNGLASAKDSVRTNHVGNVVLQNNLTVGQTLSASQIDTTTIVSSEGGLTMSDWNGYGKVEIGPTGNIWIEGNSNETLIFQDGAMGLTADDADFTMSYGEAILYCTGAIWLEAPVIELSNSKLKSPGTPTLGTHVGSRDYNDARYVLKSGGLSATNSFEAGGVIHTVTVINGQITAWTQGGVQ